MKASEVTQTLFEQLAYRSERQKVISANIANLDTPKYKTKELTFKNHLDKSNNDFELQLKTTNSRHILPQRAINNDKYSLSEVKGLEEQNDGNNVNLDKQMVEQSKNNTLFSAIQNSIKKDSSWFKLMIDASAKN